MRLITTLLLLFSIYSPTVFSQKTNFEKRISSLFFDFDLSKKPAYIEGEYWLLIDTGPQPKKEQNITEFATNPVIKSKFNNGYFNVHYYHSEEYYNKYGLYVLYMKVIYKGSHSQADARKEYERLIKMFKDDQPDMYFILEPRDRSANPRELGTGFQLNKNIKIPGLVIKYKKVDTGTPEYSLEIKYTTTWDFKLLKNGNY